MKQLHLLHTLGPESFEAGADASRLSVLADKARHLEKAGFSALIFPNENGPEAVRDGKPFLPCEPFTACGALAASTTAIGLIAAVPAATSEPYNVARRLASLDHISRGRTGWNLIRAVDGLSEQYCDHSSPSRSETLEKAFEFTEVVQALWNSWSPEAIIVEPDGTSSIDGSHNHPIFHEGVSYKVKGPLDVPKPPQGHPVCFQEVTINEDMAFPARFADVVIPHIETREEMEAFRSMFLAHVRESGRSTDQIRIVPRLSSMPSEDAGSAAKLIAEWLTDGLMDGVCVASPIIDRFTTEVIPLLRARGLLIDSEGQPFLRKRLGLI